ncbi:MAG: hypothetical protein GC145_09450 [Caulobacter sp.]|nr:hypothetical protein [Caulobacter sp.]
MRSVFLLAMVLTGCATVGQSSMIPISYVSEDRPSEGRMYVRFTNGTGKSLCLYPTNWPGADGRIDTASDRVSITIGGASFSTADFDSGYCPGCQTKVAPGEGIVAFFNYKDFNIPEYQYGSEKTLVFRPIASICSKATLN